MTAQNTIRMTDTYMYIAVLIAVLHVAVQVAVLDYCFYCMTMTMNHAGQHRAVVRIIPLLGGQIQLTINY